MGQGPCTIVGTGQRATLPMAALAAAGVAGVIKHMPGHGRAGADSHKELPTVHAEAEALERDLAPFRALAQHARIGMTGHILFPAWDAQEPATQSRRIVQDIIRGAIGFDGLLMSDDIDMQALSGTIPERSAKAIAARVEALAREITTHYADCDKLVVVGLLRGSFVFIADLVREIHLPVEVDFLEASSYGDAMHSSREVQILKDLRGEIAGRDVLVVEDIVDTGFNQACNFWTETMFIRHS